VVVELYRRLADPCGPAVDIAIPAAGINRQHDRVRWRRDIEPDDIVKLLGKGLIIEASVSTNPLAAMVNQPRPWQREDSFSGRK